MKPKNALNAGSINGTPLANQAPVYNGETTLFRGAHAGHPYTVTAIDLLVGYIDPDGDTLSVIDLHAEHATITDNLDGTYLVTPDEGYKGLVDLNYTISDGRGGTLNVDNTIYFLPELSAGPSVVVNTTTPGSQMSPDIAVFSDGGYVITWISAPDEEGDPDDQGVYMQRYNAAGVAQGAEIQVASDSGAGDLIGQAASITVLADDNVVVAWQTQSAEGSPSVIYIQQFDGDGVAIGDPVQVNATAESDQTEPQVTTLHDGGFLVTWVTDGDIAMQRFDADGEKDGVQTVVNTVTDGNQTHATVSAFADGGWIVVWQGDVASPSDSLMGGDIATGTDVFAQRYDSDGHKVGDETLINSVRYGDQGLASVATLTDGGYVVTWSGTDIEDSNVYLQRYDADGQKVGDETAVNSPTTNQQIFGKVAALSDGGYVVSWLSWSETFHMFFDVYIQRYDAAGQPVDDETLVSSPIGISLLHDVVGLPDGDYLMAWTGFAFDEDLNPVTDAFDILKSVHAAQRAPVLGGPQAVLTHATEDMDYLVSAPDLLTGVTDINGDDLEITAISADHGSAVDNHDGTFTITPATNFRGDLTLTYTVSDGHGNTVEVEHDLTVDGVIDTVRSATTATLDTYIENLILIGDAAIDGSGNASDNVITGNRGVNTLIGNDGNDTLKGADGDDTLRGNAGHDRLDGGSGKDSLYGGAGDDSYFVDNLEDLVSESATPGVDAGGNDTVFCAVNWTLDSRFENLVLTGSALTGTGNDLNNSLTGNSGNNVLDGGLGADTLSGGTGSDYYHVDNAGDRVREDAAGGNDTIVSLISFRLGANIENLELAGADDLKGIGNDANNFMVGNIGNNVLNGMAGADTMYGQAGNDTYYVDDIGDLASEQGNLDPDDGGIDTVIATIDWTLIVNFENLTLAGTTGISGTGNALANLITGNSGRNGLVGGDGNDTLNGGSNLDTMTGGNGDDLYYVDAIGDSVIEVDAAGTDTVRAYISYTLSDHVENLILSGATDIDGNGNALANVITGNSGKNALIGGDGNDTLNGGQNLDTMTGGNGDDLYYVDNLGDSVVEADAGGIDTVRASVTYSLSDTIENLVLTGGNPVNGTGNDLANSLTGNSGNNILTGGGGNDSLNGSLGNDTLIGGAGDDKYYVDSNHDRITETNDGGIDIVYVTANYSMDDYVENLTINTASGVTAYGNSLGNVMTGGAGSDALYGADGNDTLSGGLSNDTLDGGHGADLMTGGMGSDSYYIDNVGDRIREYADGGYDQVRSSVTTQLGAYVELLYLVGSAAIDGTGNALDNDIISNAGNNHLTGGLGADRFYFMGGFGADTLTDFDASQGDILLIDDDLDHTTITQSGNSTVIMTHNGDSITLLNTVATDTGLLDALSFVGSL